MTALALESLELSRFSRWIAPTSVVLVAYGVVPFIGSNYLFEAILMPFLALSLAAVGLNLLTGYAGQVSLGTAAFMAVGAYTAYNLNLRLPGMPLIGSIVLAGVGAGLTGHAFRLPSFRCWGFYLRRSTVVRQLFR